MGNIKDCKVYFEKDNKCLCKVCLPLQVPENDSSECKNCSDINHIDLCNDYLGDGTKCSCITC